MDKHSFHLRKSSTCGAAKRNITTTWVTNVSHICNFTFSSIHIGNKKKQGKLVLILYLIYSNILYVKYFTTQCKKFIEILYFCFCFVLSLHNPMCILRSCSSWFRPLASVHSQRWLVATSWMGQGRWPSDDRPAESATGVHLHLEELEKVSWHEGVWAESQRGRNEGQAGQTAGHRLPGVVESQN